MKELKDYSILDIEAIDDERFTKESAHGKWVPESRVYLKDDVDAAIAELKAENERLKRCEIWMKQHFYCEEVIACESSKNRRLKRALYKAIANWAHHRVFVRLYTNEKAWENVESKCRAKAEQYK